MSARRKDVALENTKDDENVELSPRFYGALIVLFLISIGSSVSAYLISSGSKFAEMMGSSIAMFLLLFVIQWTKLCGSSLDCKRKAYFDELNRIETYHVPDRNTRAMIAAEPRTPWEADQKSSSDIGLDQTHMKAMALTQEAGDPHGPDLHMQKMTEFERQRLMMYDEGRMIKAAQKMMEEEKKEREGKSGSGSNDNKDNVKKEPEGKSGSGSSANKDNVKKEPEGKSDNESSDDKDNVKKEPEGKSDNESSDDKDNVKKEPEGKSDNESSDDKDS